MEINMEDSFEYGRYHFIPYRKFKQGEIDRHLRGDSRPWNMDARFAMRNMRTDFELGLFAGERPHKNQDYSHASFYAASTNKKCDIFKCIENGKLYVPGENELFGYTEPIQRTRSNSYER